MWKKKNSIVENFFEYFEVEKWHFLSTWAVDSESL